MWLFDNRPAETSRIFGAQEEAEGSGHENKGATRERICCREWSAGGSSRSTGGKWSTHAWNTPRRIRKKRSNIDSLIDDDARGGGADIVGDENVGGIGSEPGAQRHSR